MRIDEARAAVQEWVTTEATHLPGFLGAYTAGSTNWLPASAEFPATSDLDIMLVLAQDRQILPRRKFQYRNLLLEVSYVSEEQIRTPDLILSDYHLGPSFETATILLDPSHRLRKLQELVRREYAKPPRVLQRCSNARNKVLSHLHSINAALPLYDQATACLFGAGVTAHILLSADLQNPTVRTRYAAARKVLARHDKLELHQTLLELLGSAAMSRERVHHHLATLTHAFDTAAKWMRTPFPFASDLSRIARPLAIEGSSELIENGHYREAMFWIAVTYSRCQKVLAIDAPQELSPAVTESYRELLLDLGLASATAIKQRAADIERTLPSIWEAVLTITERPTVNRSLGVCDV